MVVMWGGAVSLEQGIPTSNQDMSGPLAWRACHPEVTRTTHLSFEVGGVMPRGVRGPASAQNSSLGARITQLGPD